MLAPVALGLFAVWIFAVGILHLVGVVHILLCVAMIALLWHLTILAGWRAI